eukprot:SAG22_NODE_261_length_13373_cov_17.745472_5_plen_86_part_00
MVGSFPRDNVMKTIDSLFAGILMAAANYVVVHTKCHKFEGGAKLIQPAICLPKFTEFSIYLQLGCLVLLLKNSDRTSIIRILSCS